LDRILLGLITGAHGIKGEVKIRSFTEEPKAIGSYGPLQTADGRVIAFARLRVAKDHFIGAITGVVDRTAAEALRGTELFGLRSAVAADEVLLADLTGRRVLHGSSILGTATGFHNFGAGELLELDTGLLIPVRFITQFAPDVVVDLPDGFLDDGVKE
jgi:16S rRNA processing protein RimM